MAASSTLTRGAPALRAGWPGSVLSTRSSVLKAQVDDFLFFYVLHHSATRCPWCPKEKLGPMGKVEEMDFE